MAALAEAAAAAPPAAPGTDADGVRHFETPKIVLNEGGWGAPSNHLPEQFSWLPFAEFGKGDRLGRVADFSRNDGWRFNRNQTRRPVEEERADANDGFELQDNSKKEAARRRGGFNKRWRGGFRRNWNNRNRGNRGGQKSHTLGVANKGRKGIARPQGNWRGRKKRLKNGSNYRFRRRRFGDDQRKHAFEDTCRVGADWQVIEQYELKALLKLSAATPGEDETEDLMWCGELASYNDAYDRVSTKNPKRLAKNKAFRVPRVTAREDAHLQRMAQEGEGNVFATERVLAAIMLSPRSVYPWDLVITKLRGADGGPLLFIDKRDDTLFDLLTVNETAVEQPGKKRDPKKKPWEKDEEMDPNDVNAPLNLMKEATAINGYFTQQILDQARKQQLKMPNPFEDDDSDDDGEGGGGASPPCATAAYRYRRFTLPNGVRLVARCELNGVHEVKKGKGKLKHKLTCFALNEWDSKKSGGLNWRQKLDSQRGAVLATELKNNSTKLGRWTAQSLLAGVDKMLIGYVSRRNVTKNVQHEILGTQFYKPKSFATQINLSQRNMWGIVRFIIDLLQKQEGDGKYVLMRDSTKPLMRLYKVPMSTFEDDDDEEEEWDGQGAI